MPLRLSCPKNLIFFFITFLFFNTPFSAVWAADTLSVGIYSTEAYQSSYKLSWYKDFETENLNLGIEADLVNGTQSLAFNQVQMHHFYASWENVHYLAHRLEKITLGNGLLVNNYQSSIRPFFIYETVGQEFDAGFQDMRVYFFQNQKGLQAYALSWENNLLPSTNVQIFTNNVQQSRFKNLSQIQAQSLGFSIKWDMGIKIAYEKGSQGSYEADLKEISLPPLFGLHPYYRETVYAQGFLPEYWNRFQYDFSTTANIGTQSSSLVEKGILFCPNEDSSLKFYQKTIGKNSFVAGELLWALSDSLLMEYQYDKPLPAYTQATNFEQQSLKLLLTESLNRQLSVKYSKLQTPTPLLSFEDLFIEFVLKI